MWRSWNVGEDMVAGRPPSRGMSEGKGPVSMDSSSPECAMKGWRERALATRRGVRLRKGVYSKLFFKENNKGACFKAEGGKSAKKGV